MELGQLLQRNTVDIGMDTRAVIENDVVTGHGVSSVSAGGVAAYQARFELPRIAGKRASYPNSIPPSQPKWPSWARIEKVAAKVGSEVTPRKAATRRRSPSSLRYHAAQGGIRAG
jgi:hypothetical protein